MRKSTAAAALAILFVLALGLPAVASALPIRQHGITGSDVAAVRVGQARWHVQHRLFHGVPGHTIARTTDAGGVIHKWRAYPVSWGREVVVEYVTAAGMDYGQVVASHHWCAGPVGAPVCAR